MQQVQFNATWFVVDGGGNSRAEFHAGQCYPVSDKTMAHVSSGIAEVTEVPDAPAPDAPAPAPDAPAA